MTSSPPTISIVLPTHNGEAFLEESIESCLSQTFEDFELIIVDDASTDHTPKIVADFASRDGRVRAITNEENLRLPASLNRGFSEARGEFFTWTSDDNRYAPKALAKLLGLLREHPNASLAYADEILIDGAGTEFSRREREPFCYHSGCNVVGACFLYRQDHAAKVGDYDTERYLSEDYDYWLRLAAAGPFVRVPEFLYSYRMHENNLTSRFQDEIRQRSLDAKIDHSLKIRSIPPRWRQHAALGIARTAWAQGRRRTALTFAVHGLALSPIGAIKSILAKLSGRSSLPPVPQS